MIMPNELTDLADDVVNRIKRCGPIDLGFQPLPEAFDGIVFWRIRFQMFECYPVVLLQESLDRAALMNCGILQHQNQQDLGKALVELMQKLQKHLGRAAPDPLPIKALGTEMQGAKQGGTVALRWGRHFDLVALAKPAALDRGFVGQMRRIDTEDFYRSVRLAGTDSGDNFCHPSFFFSALGALRGTVLAKRL